MAEAPAQTSKRALIVVFLTVLMSMVGLGLIIPIMPSLIIELTGVDEPEAARMGGYLLTAYALMQFVMAPIIGGLSDQIGRRPVILTSVGCYALDFVFMALAPTYAWLFVGRLISGATAATYSAATAYIADVSPPEKRAANFGVMGAAFGLGFILGPTIGGLSADAFGVRAPFIIAAMVMACNFVFGWFFLKETLAPENRRRFDIKRANPIGGLISVGKHPLVFGVLFAYFLMQLAHNSLPAVWAYFAIEKFSWTESQIGLSLSYVGVTAAFVQGYLTRKAIPKLGERKAVMIGLCATIIALTGYSVFSPSGGFIFMWITVGAIGGFMMPGMQGIMSRATPANVQGELQGAIASVMSITMAISPLIATQVFGMFTDGSVVINGEAVYFPGAPFALAAAITALALIPFWITMRNVPRAVDAENSAPTPDE